MPVRRLAAVSTAALVWILAGSSRASDVCGDVTDRAALSTSDAAEATIGSDFRSETTVRYRTLDSGAPYPLEMSPTLLYTGDRFSDALKVLQ